MHLLYTDRQTTMTRAQKKDIHGMRHFCKGDIQTIHHCRVCQMHTLIPLLGRGVLVSIIIWWTMYTLRVAVISNWNEGLTSGWGGSIATRGCWSLGGGGSSSSLSMFNCSSNTCGLHGLLVVMQVQNMWNVCN